jgi:hypothetical protein
MISPTAAYRARAGYSLVNSFLSSGYRPAEPPDRTGLQPADAAVFGPSGPTDNR